ncbi:hypothetical protein BKA70DRAFT_1242728 [Coprinopsis sp. MPI-PUGE-AT-0042]|nr:hypothetical protein BKA70DRAFT_1242728 [Coprinopsis sp. MPI-PUGE-AT-0042]
MLLSTHASKLVLILLCLLVYLILPVTSLPLPARSSKKSKKTHNGIPTTKQYFSTWHETGRPYAMERCIVGLSMVGAMMIDNSMLKSEKMRKGGERRKSRQWSIEKPAQTLLPSRIPEPGDQVERMRSSHRENSHAWGCIDTLDVYKARQDAQYEEALARMTAKPPVAFTHGTLYQRAIDGASHPMTEGPEQRQDGEVGMHVMRKG